MIRDGIMNTYYKITHIEMFLGHSKNVLLLSVMITQPHYIGLYRHTHVLAYRHTHVLAYTCTRIHMYSHTCEFMYGDYLYLCTLVSIYT